MELSIDLSDLTLIEIPFEYGGKSYVLREATGAVARKYNNERTNRLTYNAEGRIASSRDLADTIPMLVAGCVFTAEGNAIPQSVIETWPDRLVKRLFNTIRKVSFGEGAASEHQLSQVMDEPGFPIDKESWLKFIESLDKTKYADLKLEFARPKPKE